MIRAPLCHTFDGHRSCVSVGQAQDGVERAQDKRTVPFSAFDTADLEHTSGPHAGISETIAYIYFHGTFGVNQYRLGLWNVSIAVQFTSGLEKVH